MDVTMLAKETWFVTGRHRALCKDANGVSWRPYAEHHARRVGDRLTLCGLPAYEWPMFWDMQFQVEDPRSCPACVARLRGS